MTNTNFYMRSLTALFILSTICFTLPGQDTIRQSVDSLEISSEVNAPFYISFDSSHVTRRPVDTSKLDELRRSDDFDYRQPPTIAESLWDRFLSWLGQMFGWLFSNAVNTPWGNVLLYALGIIVLAAIVMMLLRVDALRVFYSGSDKGMTNYQTISENIHEMDFENLIRDALIKKEYRNGVRLTFLYSLKLLSDKQHLQWKPGKTNHDYLEELRESELRTGFNELSFYFDYTWYGEFAVNETLFNRVQSIFENWRKKIG